LLVGQRHQITENLYQFLHILAAEGSDCWIWADQLCINQQDIPERNAQVSIMGTIYRNAQVTTIWLGSDIDNTSAYNADWAMEQLSQPSIADYEITRESLFLGDSDIEMPTSWEHSPFHVLAILKKADYWRRMWILQEIILSQNINIRFGTSEIAWSQLNTFYRRCESFATDIEAARQLKPSFFGEHDVLAYKTYAMGRLIDHAENPTSVNLSTWRSLLTYSSGRLSKDPRDQIYALLELISKHLTITPSYNMDIRSLHVLVLETEMRGLAAQASYEDIEQGCPMVVCREVSDRLSQAMGAFENFEEVMEFVRPEGVLFDMSCGGCDGDCLSSTLMGTFL
jgi:hypothetical protein